MTRSTSMVYTVYRYGLRRPSLPVWFTPSTSMVYTVYRYCLHCLPVWFTTSYTVNRYVQLRCTGRPSSLLVSCPSRPADSAGPAASSRPHHGDLKPSCQTVSQGSRTRMRHGEGLGCGEGLGRRGTRTSGQPGLSGTGLKAVRCARTGETGHSMLLVGDVRA